MTLAMLKKGQKAKVETISCDLELKNRLYSFGIVKNAILNVDEWTFRKKTIKIEINNSRVALRACEADTINVKAI